MKENKLKSKIEGIYVVYMVCSVFFLANYTYHQNEGIVKFITLGIIIVGAGLILYSFFRLKRG